MSLKPDAYTVQARQMPALLVALPVALTVWAWPVDHPLGWQGLLGLIVAAGGMLLMAQVGGEMGKRREPKLYEKFGGRPSERLLSFVHAPNQHVVARRHEQLQTLMPHLHIPNEQEELADPYGAYKVYEANTTFLISKLRGTDTGKLVFAENVNYGFRRNLWGMKSIGLPLALAGAVILGLRLYLDFTSHVYVSPLLPILFATNVVLVLMWLFVLRPSWVRTSANAYANRLLECIEQL